MSMQEQEVNMRGRMVWDIYLALNARKFDKDDTVALVCSATGRCVSVPQDGQDYDPLDGLTDSEVHKVHSIVTAWEGLFQ